MIYLYCRINLNIIIIYRCIFHLVKMRALFYVKASVSYAYWICSATKWASHFSALALLPAHFLCAKLVAKLTENPRSAPRVSPFIGIPCQWAHFINTSDTTHHSYDNLTNERIVIKLTCFYSAYARRESRICEIEIHLRKTARSLFSSIILRAVLVRDFGWLPNFRTAQ